MIRIFTIVLLLTGTVVTSTTDAQTLDLEVTVNALDDSGQSFGTLFEARAEDGTLAAGAGFQDVYNTRFRNDRFTLQFFVRPQDENAGFELTRLPHPDLGCGVYLFDLDGEVYAWSSVQGNSVRRWDAHTERWVAELPPKVPQLRSGDGIMRVGSGHLVFSSDCAWYNQQQILSPPASGGWFNFYYAQGHLFFYHRVSGDTKSTHLLACPWTPESDAPIDLNKAVRFKTLHEAETPFSWGQWRDQVLTISNTGGIYVFADDQWTMALAPDRKTSYQVYSALLWQQRLLLAQYPTGNVFAWDGRTANHLRDWPPVLPGVAGSARECQTLCIYRGDLMAGVWPWAEVWRCDVDSQNWTSHDRAFTHPELTTDFQHPYETAARQQGWVLNHWGQRVTSMIPGGDSLLLSTSSKGTVEWTEDEKFLSESQRREYGAVLRLKMPGNLSAPVQWTGRPVHLRFIVRDGQMQIEQDGRRIASTLLPFNRDLSNLNVQFGSGLFGPAAWKIEN